MLTQIYRISGRVQGVGFRFTATRLAAKHSIRGKVSNEFDGSVKLSLQGEKAKQEDYLQDLKKHDTNPYIRVDQIDFIEEVDQKPYSDFRSIY